MQDIFLNVTYELQYMKLLIVPLFLKTEAIKAFGLILLKFWQDKLWYKLIRYDINDDLSKLKDSVLPFFQRTVLHGQISKAKAGVPQCLC